MRPADNINQLIKKMQLKASADLDKRVHEKITNATAKLNLKESAVTQPNIWSNIMKNPMTKLAAAAIIVIAISLIGLFSQDQNNINDFSLLTKACAAENILFTGEEIVHIKNEITVFPTAEVSDEPDSVWLPMCSLRANGQFMFNQLTLPVYAEQYTVYDQAWYEPTTGRFIRILSTDEKVVFANSYDGEFIYTSQTESNGTLQLPKQAITEDFIPPLKPAQFLGMGAGLKSGLGQETPMLRDITKGMLEDGSPAKIYKVGTPGPYGKLSAYWLFRVRDDDGTIAEKEFIISGESRLLVRRILAESVKTAEYSWNLIEIENQSVTADTGPKVSITPDMVIPDVTVESMVERAGFETYIFAINPSWTQQIQIVDVIDPATPGDRMYIFAARADDGRHLVMVQSPTYNMLLGGFAKTGRLIYTSPNGFNVWGGGPSKWYAEILLNSARYFIKDPPSDDRVGYILESPAGTFPALAINGYISDEELHGIIDSLVPAREYIKE